MLHIIIIIIFMEILSSGNSLMNQSLEKECKINWCESHAASNFMWNALNSIKDVGTPCKRNDMCEWVLEKGTCILAENNDLKINRLKFGSCDNLTSKEAKHLFRSTSQSLSSLHHPQNIKFLFPFFGIALLVILGCVWTQEGAEDLCRWQKETEGRQRLQENTNTLIRFDDCDSCVVEITSEDPLRTGDSGHHPVDLPPHEDPVIALGYQEMKETSLRRSHLALTNQNQEDSGGKTPPKFPPPPRLIFETKTPIENFQYCRGKLRKSSFKPNSKERKTYTFRRSTLNNKHYSKVAKKRVNNRVPKGLNRSLHGKTMRNSALNKLCCCSRLDSQETEQHEKGTESTTGRKSNSFKFSKKYRHYTPPKQENEVKDYSENVLKSESNSEENIRSKCQFKNFGIVPDSKKMKNPQKAGKPESEVENIPPCSTINNNENADEKDTEQCEEDCSQTLSSFPQVSIDSCDLGFGMLANAWKILRAIQYS